MASKSKSSKSKGGSPVPKTKKLGDVIKKEILKNKDGLKGSSSSKISTKDGSDEITLSSEAKKRKREDVKEPSDPRKREESEDREEGGGKAPKRWWQGTQGFDFHEKLADRDRHAFNEDECCMCFDAGELLCCDGPCFRSFHLDCLGMRPAEVPAGDWFCDACAPLANARGQAEHRAARARREARERDLETKVRDREDRLQRELFTVPAKFAGPAPDPPEAARRGLGFIFRLAQSKASFAAFGSDMVQTFYDVAAVAPEPLRQYALHRVEALAQWWKERYRSLTDLGTGPRPEPSEVTDAILGIYALERVGITHTLKMEARKFVQEAKYTAADYFGFQPKDGPLSCEPEMNRYRAFTTAIVNAFYADKVGIDLGASLLDILAHLPSLRPYRPEPKRAKGDSSSSSRKNNSNDDDLEDQWEEWLDQTTMLFNLIHVCSNFGELRLDPKLVPEEAEYLLNPQLMDVCLREKDVHLVGELCHCLRVLGVTENDGEEPQGAGSAAAAAPPAGGGGGGGGPAAAQAAALRRGVAFLVRAQKADGSWPARANARDPYTRYHAAMCAVSCLSAPHFRGFGPDDARLAPLLARATAPVAAAAAAAPAAAEAKEDGAAAPAAAAAGGDETGGAGAGASGLTVLTSCGVRVCPMEGLEHVRALYEGTAQGMGGEMSLSTRERALRRLRWLLEWRRRQARRQQAAAAKAPKRAKNGNGTGGADAPAAGPGGPSSASSPAGLGKNKNARAAESSRWGRRGSLRAPEAHRRAAQAAARQLADRAAFRRELVAYRRARGEDGEAASSGGAAAAAGGGGGGGAAAAAAGGGAAAGAAGAGAAALSSSLPRPLCGEVPVDLHRLFHRVAARGGAKGLQDLQDWAAVARQVGLPASMPDRSRRLRDVYLKFLGNFETTWIQRYKEMKLKKDVEGATGKMKKKKASSSTTKTRDFSGSSDGEEWKPQAN